MTRQCAEDSFDEYAAPSGKEFAPSNTPTRPSKPRTVPVHRVQVPSRVIKVKIGPHANGTSLSGVVPLLALAFALVASNSTAPF